jgi:adenylate cyclase class IV
MDNNKVMIVGTGNVGASIAFAIMNQRTVINEIVLTDIIAKDAEDVVSLFKELGFEVRHNPKGIGVYDTEEIRMKDGNGFHLDVSVPDIDFPNDFVGIRINVDDFDEAYELLQKHGFKNIYVNKTINTGSSKSATMFSPSKFVIKLVQHIKEHE